MAAAIPTLSLLSDADRASVISVCEQFGREVDQDNAASLNERLAGWHGDSRSVLLRELLLIELHFRHRHGQTPEREEYRSQFADSGAVVDSVFDLISSENPAESLEAESTIMSTTFGETLVEGATNDSKVETMVETPDPSTSPRPPRVDPSAETEKDQYDVETQLPEPSDSTPYDVATIDQDSVATPQPTRFPGAPSQLPADYQLLGILGQGGMGLVYKARQKRADRMVALKVIRPEKLSGMSTGSRDRAIERFRAEAQAAGRLQHDNLVTVFEVGESDGCHYFSMQFVDGKCLADMIREGPLEERTAAGYMEPVCRAVHYAHEQGILHRDIKPHNILIETATQRPRIADFGLAKIIDADMEMTRAGESMGTPPYMPPEQFGDAANVTAAADVYGLGATLYQLLSGRPPFQAATAITTMRLVLERDPVRLQELNAAVDKDLETICMRCLEKEPQRRYATAGELADELQRYLNGEPILARPLGPAARFWRWCRRNPVVSSLSGTVVVAILISVASLAIANVRTEEARQLSEASFQDALGAVNDFFTRVSEDRLLNEPGFQVLRRDLLELARDYYGQLIERRTGDPELESEVAASHFRLGLIIEELDSSEAAQASYEKALTLQRELCRKEPDSSERQQALSKTINALGRLATRSGDFEKARERFDETVSIREELVQATEDPGERFEFDRLLANGWMNIGLLHRNLQEFDEARRLMASAQEHRKMTLPVRPTDRAMRRDLAKGWYNLANLGVDVDDAQAVEKNVVLAIREFEALLDEDSEDLRDRYMLSLCYRLLADLKAAMAAVDPDLINAAIENYSKALLAVRELAGRNPAVPTYRGEVAQLLLNLGQLEAQRQRFDPSRELIQEAETLLRALTEELPDRTDYAELHDLAGQMLEQLRNL
jgi:serine/threonine-protein kinase